MIRRRNKFGAVPTVVDGIRFASKREAARYAQLRQMQTLGLISRLELQPKFKCVVEGEHVGTYIADFAYFQNNARVIEDSKTRATATPVYRLKKKLVQALFRVEIKEV